MRLANHDLTLSQFTTLLTHSFEEQVFLVALLPQRVAPNSTCLKWILVIPNFRAFYF